MVDDFSPGKTLQWRSFADAKKKVTALTRSKASAKKLKNEDVDSFAVG